MVGGDTMYYLATCDDNGKCFGFLRTDNTISKDPDNEIEKMMYFRRKSDANEKALQINLGHTLLQNGTPYRVAIVKG
jgi:hypothetical protein